jgi:hypothetical protein
MVRAGRAMRTDGFLIPKKFISEIGHIRAVMPDQYQDHAVKLSKVDWAMIPARITASRAINYSFGFIIFKDVPSKYS